MSSRTSLSVLAVAAAGLTVTLAPVAAHAAAPPAGLASGARLASGQSLASPSGTYTLTMQTDGNLVERTTLRAGAVWSTQTSGRTGATLTMQTDGNLVLRTATAGPVWTTSTAGNPGATLRIQDDGNIVVAARSGRAVWTKGVDRPQPPELSGTLRVGQSWTDQQTSHRSSSDEFGAYVFSGQFSVQQEVRPAGLNFGTPTWSAPRTGSSQGATRLTLQTDGNLVLYVAGQAVWTTSTAGRDAATFTMQDDGNLVLRSTSGGTLWSSGSGRKLLAAGNSLAPGQQLRQVDPATYRVIAAATMQTDGNFVFSKDGRVRWSSGTRSPGSSLTVQTDGNMVIRAPGGRVVWSTGTSGTGNANVLFLDYYSPLYLTSVATSRTVWSVG